MIWQQRFDKLFIGQSHIKREEVKAFIELEMTIMRRQLLKKLEKIIKKEAL